MWGIWSVMKCTEQQQQKGTCSVTLGFRERPPGLGVPYQGQLLCPGMYEQGPLCRFYCGRAICSACGAEC